MAAASSAGKIVGIDGHELEPVWLAGPIDDVNPDRLDAAPGHGDAKKLPTRDVIQHCNPDLKILPALVNGSVQEPSRGRAGRVRNHEPAKNGAVTQPHAIEPPRAINISHLPRSIVSTVRSDSRL